MNLYIVYLGGPPLPGRMTEDHEVVVVVAEDITSARKFAKAKWGGAGSAHVDAVQQISIIDGYRILLEKTEVVNRQAYLDLTYSE